MNWQEYQEAVACLYEQIDEIGTVHRNVFLPDKVTGQRRQIDVLVEINAKGHTLRMVVDAKFRATPIDVKDVEEVLALADAVGANKAVLVASNGWTAPSEIKAKHLSCDLKLLTLEDALDYLVSDKWEMCPECEQDCIVLDQDGYIITPDGLLFWWLAGRCRECSFAFAWCQECGSYLNLSKGAAARCTCGHLWENRDDGISLTFAE